MSSPIGGAGRVGDFTGPGSCVSNRDFSVVKCRRVEYKRKRGCGFSKESKTMKIRQNYFAQLRGHLAVIESR